MRTSEQTLQFAYVLNHRVSAPVDTYRAPGRLPGFSFLSFPFRIRVPEPDIQTSLAYCWRRTSAPETGAVRFSTNQVSAASAPANNLEVFRVSNPLARIDVNQRGHWSLLSFRLPR